MKNLFSFRRLIALALAAFTLAGAVPSQAAGSGIVEQLFVQPGTGAVARTYLDKLRELPISVKDFGAKGNGTDDDTAAINTAFEAARVANKCVYAPAGTYIVQQLLFGTQATVAQSSAPSCMYGDAWKTTFKAKAGFTGTVLKAWSIAGVVFENFEIDGNNTAGTCIDSEWKPGTGPSTQNRYVNIRCNGATGTGWNAKNNSDAVFDRVVINGAGHDKTCLDFTAPGGLAWILNSIWNNCSLKFGAQNGVIRDSWGHGIQFAQGALNYVELSGVYLYWNTSMQAVLKSESFASFQSVHGLTAIGSQFIGPDSASAGGIIDLNAYSHLDFIGSQFITSGTVNMFGPNARGDSYEKPIVLFQGGSSNFTPNSTSVFDVNFDGFMNDGSGYFFPTSERRSTLQAGTAAATEQTPGTT